MGQPPVRLGTVPETILAAWQHRLRPSRAPLAQLPNALTVLGVLVPVFVVLMLNADDGYSWAAGIIFAVAAITDQIDAFWPVAGTSSPSSARSPTRSPTG